MRKLLLTSLSVLALSAGAAQAGNTFHYPSGMSAGTQITSLSQVVALQNAIISQGKADGVLTGSYYQNNPNGPQVAVTAQNGALGVDNAQYIPSTGQVDIDHTLLLGTMTAEEIGALLAHEDIHPMQAGLTNDGLTEDEQASLDEHAADQGAASIMGDGGQGTISWLSQMISDDMNMWGDSVDDANSDLSNAVMGSPWSRANSLCSSCSLPHNILGNTDYDIGADKTIIDGQEETIPSNDDQIDGQTPNTLSYLDDEFEGEGEDSWGNVDYWGGGGDWGGFGCSKINGVDGNAANGGVQNDNRIVGGC